MLNPPIRAELTGDDTATAASITVTGNAPVLVLCRHLLEAGHDLATCLQAWRGSILSLTVRSIGEGAKLTVRDDRHGVPRFVAYRPGPAGRGREGCGEAPLIVPMPLGLTSGPNRAAEEPA